MSYVIHWLVGIPNIGVCLAERAPSIHKNASIQWEDMHFQVKPDGIPMYLVSVHNVLIGELSFPFKHLMVQCIPIFCPGKLNNK